MVAIGLSAAAAARIRFAMSCLWEVVASVRLLRDPGVSPVHQRWALRVRPGLVAAGLTDGLLWKLISPTGMYTPDFLTPPPADLDPDLGDELAVLCATPGLVVRAHLDLMAGDRAPDIYDFYADPPAGLSHLAGEIAQYWRLAIAPQWSRMRALLDAEVQRRARQLAEKGAEATLNDLHERVHWSDGTLEVDQPHCTARDVPDAAGLVLIPSAFVWPSVLSVAAVDAPQLAYPARGVATLWESPAPIPAALSAVLGRGRAQLLAELNAPLSTTELSQRTGISAGGVSQHLATLRAAGLVSTHRQGRMLLNARTAVAEALLSASV